LLVKDLISVMKPLYTLALLFFVQTSFAQIKQISVPFEHGDTLDLYSWMRKQIAGIGLEDLRYCRKEIHFRFWLESQAVEVWKNNSGFYEGHIINLGSTESPVYPQEENEKAKLYTELVSLDTSTARQVAEHLLHLKLFGAPSQDSLKYLAIVDDGLLFYVEYSDPGKYTFKNYDAPGWQVDAGLKEVKPVDDTFKYLLNKLKLEESWGRFVKTLPKDCYIRMGISISCTVMSPGK
jgi:hypothetical protein